MSPFDRHRKLPPSLLRWIALAICMAALSGCGWVSRRWHGGEPEQPVADPSAATRPASTEAPVAAPAQTDAAPVPAIGAEHPSPVAPAAVAAPAASEPKRASSPVRPAQRNADAAIDLGCVDADRLNSRYTPADLYPAMARCLAQADYRKAVLISALAGTYTRFDTLRIADPTAHDASVALTLRATSTVSDEQKKTFRTTQQSLIGNPADFAALCKSIERIGPPSYFPMYMIEHGKSSSSDGKGSVLVPDFDIAAGWQQALTTYLHCAKS